MAKQISKISVEGMSCDHCVNRIKKSVGGLKGVDSVDVDLKSKTVTVGFEEQTLGLKAIKEAIEEQGYDVL